MNKLFVAIVGIAVVLALINVGLVLFGNGAQTPPSQPFAEVPPEGQITVEGIITCIPKIGDGPMTMECAMGLQDDEGTYYGMRHLADLDPTFSFASPDIRVRVAGTLVHEEMFGPDGNRYDIVGIIEVESIEEIDAGGVVDRVGNDTQAVELDAQTE